MAEKLPRPWHGASDREEDAAVQALRLQRLEVEALLAFRRAGPEAPDAAALWQRLAALRDQRRAVLSAADAAALPPLPPAPASPEGTPPGGWRGMLARMVGRRGRAAAAGPPAAR